MKTPANRIIPTTTLCTATRRETTYHRDPTGTCKAITASQTTVDLALHTTELDPADAETLTVRLAVQSLDLLS